MINEILKEELGISNKVSLLTLRIKELINNDFGKIKTDINFFKTKPLLNGKNIKVIENELITPFEGLDIYIHYYVAIPNNTMELNLFIKSYTPECDNNLEKPTIHIPLVPNNLFKIEWNNKISAIQHEVHHMFQIIKRGKPILNHDEMVEYNKFCDLAISDNNVDKYIGFVFYYAIRAEKEAFANSLYRNIMELNKESYIVNPIDVLKDYSTYKMINNIKNMLITIKKDNNKLITLENRLNELSINLDYFIKIANNVVNSYIKSFGRVICKAKEDLYRIHNRLK